VKQLKLLMLSIRALQFEMYASAGYPVLIYVPSIVIMASSIISPAIILNRRRKRKRLKGEEIDFILIILHIQQLLYNSL